MPSSDGDNDPDLRFWTRDQMLDFVRTGAERRRRTHRIGLATVVLVALIATAGAITVAGRSPDRTATVAATGGGGGFGTPATTATPPMSSPMSSPVAPTTTVLTPEPGVTVTSPPTTARAATTTEPTVYRGNDVITSPPITANTPTTLPDCRNSRDPACGPFRWDPQPPANQPFTANVTVGQVGGPASRTFSFHVVFDDPDAFIPDFCRGVQWGDGAGEACARTAIGCATQYGVWAPPAPKPGHVEFDVTHTYEKAGTFEVSFSSYSTVTEPCADPFAGSAIKKVTVVVP